MHIYVSVDQAESVRRGADAPHSTVPIEVYPADLSAEQREWIADHLEDGHKLRVTVPMPTIEGLVEAIDDALDAEAEREREREQRMRELDASIREAIETARGRRTVETVSVWSALLSRYVKRQVEVEQVPQHNKYVGESDDARRALEEAIDAARERNAPLLAAARERLAAEVEAEEAEYEAERDALYARLPEALRRRAADGYASDGEIRHRLARLIRADAGYCDPYRSWDGEEVLSELSDAEYAQLVEQRERAPEGAKVEPVLVWSGERGYREATEYDDPDSVDEDGEVWHPGDDPERAIMVTLPKVGGVSDVRALIRFRADD